MGLGLEGREGIERDGMGKRKGIMGGRGKGRGKGRGGPIPALLFSTLIPVYHTLYIKFFTCNLFNMT